MSTEPVKKTTAPARRAAAATPATTESTDVPGVTVLLEWEKATPGTVRFKEVTAKGGAPKLRTVYVTNDGLAEAAKKAGVTLDDVELLEVTYRVVKRT